MGCVDRATKERADFEIASANVGDDVENSKPTADDHVDDEKHLKSVNLPTNACGEECKVRFRCPFCNTAVSDSFELPAWSPFNLRSDQLDTCHECGAKPAVWHSAERNMRLCTLCGEHHKRCVKYRDYRLHPCEGMKPMRVGTKCTRHPGFDLEFFSEVDNDVVGEKFHKEIFRVLR